MKVEIKDLYPNPYRDMDNYPINRVKVDSLKASIKQTGFWDNIVGRLKKGTVLSGYSDQGYLVGDFNENHEPIEIIDGGIPVYFEVKKGGVEIAYGHHRLTALREALPWDTIVDIPVKDLPDSTMIQIMANENMQEYSTSPATIDETVKVAKKFLEENPDVAKSYGGRPGHRIGYLTIKGFLNWPEDRVQGSINRLNLIESGTVSKEAIHGLGTDNAARSLTKIIKDIEASPVLSDDVKKEMLSLENQKKVVERIKKSEDMSLENMRNQFYVGKEKKKKEKKKKEQYTTYKAFVNDITSATEELKTGYNNLLKLYEQMGEVPETIETARLIESIKGLERIIFLIKTNTFTKQLTNHG
jgi:ParB-like chromosome segregation protein Spo0J